MYLSSLPQAPPARIGQLTEEIKKSLADPKERIKVLLVTGGAVSLVAGTVLGLAARKAVPRTIGLALRVVGIPAMGLGIIGILKHTR